MVDDLFVHWWADKDYFYLPLLKLLKKRDEKEKITQSIKFSDQNALGWAIGTISLK